MLVLENVLKRARHNLVVEREHRLDNANIYQHTIQYTHQQAAIPSRDATLGLDGVLHC